MAIALSLGLILAGCNGAGSAASTPASQSANDPPPALAVSTSSLSQGRVSSAYSATLQASGGTAPYGWLLTGGQLPSGLGLTSAGQISGTPTATGQYNFTAQVSDSSSPVQTASAKLSITIAAIALTIGAAALPTGSLNTAYNGTLSASGGTTPYTWSVASGSLPAGLSLSSSGQISGTPTAAGIYPFDVRASDSSSPAQTATAGGVIDVADATLDAFGGRTDVTCSTGATGLWSLEEINKRWWFCDPLGHGFFMQAVQIVNPVGDADAGGASIAKIAVGKYGDVATWAEQTLIRLRSWGFNTVGIGASASTLPWETSNDYPADSYGQHTDPYKLPIIGEIDPVPQSMAATPIAPWGGGSTWKPDQGVKDLAHFQSPYTTYKYWNAGYPPDVYDSRIYTWEKQALGEEDPYNPMNGPAWAGVPPGSRYANYLMGIFINDGDTTRAIDGQPDPNFDPNGYGLWPILGWVVATLPPTMYADPKCVAATYGAKNPNYCLYPDSTNYSKKAWESYLSSKYGTISALNSAWGSNYTTFGSSGTQITGEAVGSGDGSTTTFSHTLSDLTPSAWSIGIYVGGTLVGGDDGQGTIWGPNLTGTINYSTGALSLSFSAAPASGAAITVNYMQNGWCIGTGLIDECDQSAHRSWMGTDTTGETLSSANPQFAADAITFNGMLASELLGQENSTLKAIYPQVLNLGPDAVQGPSLPRPELLKAFKGNVDALVLSNAADPQSYMDEIYATYGNAPILDEVYMCANQDSALAQYGANGCAYSTQAARGQAYQNEVTTDFNASFSSTGDHPYVGLIWWALYDSWSEHKNWGLETVRDNSYDGKEDTSAKVPCSPPLGQYTCGNDLGSYGDVIDSVRQSNSYWFTH